ncbi:SCO6745 family protein [Actinoplanes sp. CA-142083]|uniref:SCO6745 family protein n=1 Tax=Actinoplanes sp. CA-142083 TaxID=3239903 RepID=UPI003D8F093A
MTTSTARRLWSLFEPLHAVTYFTPQAAEAFEAAGLTGFWRRYFAGRAAALGPIGPGPVTAAFFGFAPAMVTRAFPSVWSRISPQDAVTARAAGAAAALNDLFTDLPPSAVADAADLLEAAARSVDTPGRVLAAAHADLPWPTDPVVRLWHAATILREHRGDGHVAALLTAGVGGCESLVWRVGLDGGRLREVTQPARGWTDEEWEAAAGRLEDRGWLTASGEVTAEGLAAYEGVEALTDRLAAGPWHRLGEADTERCAELLAPLTARTWAVLPDDNPIPLRRPVPGQ